AGRGGLFAMVSFAPARRGCRRFPATDIVRRTLHRCRHLGRFRPHAGRIHRLEREVFPGCRGLLAIAERTRWLSPRHRQTRLRSERSKRAEVSQATLTLEPTTRRGRALRPPCRLNPHLKLPALQGLDKTYLRPVEAPDLYGLFAILGLMGVSLSYAIVVYWAF